MGDRRPRIGVISDIHSNFYAFQTCVKYMEQQGITTFLLLGDYISDTPFVRETLDYVAELQSRYQVHLLKGNREDYMLEQRSVRLGQREGPLWKNNSCSGSLLYTFEKLTEEDFAFFESLPKAFVFSAADYPAVTCCHGSPENTRELMELDGENTRQWMERVETEYLLAAHTHMPGELVWKGKRYFNAGSCGLAVNEVGRAQCLILNGTEQNGRKGWDAEFLSLPYDKEDLIRQMYESGLTERAPWFVNSILYNLITGINVTAQLVSGASELQRKADPEGKLSWPDIGEEYFQRTALELGIPDYRRNTIQKRE